MKVHHTRPPHLLRLRREKVTTLEKTSTAPQLQVSALIDAFAKPKLHWSQLLR
jgi:hypothetical protein